MGVIKKRRQQATLSLGLLLVFLAGISCFDSVGQKKRIVSRDTEKGASDQTSQDSAESPGNEQAQTPTLITGVYLVNYENARVRCDYTQTDVAQFDTVCSVIARQDDGKEIKTSNIAAGLQLAWAQPEVANSSAIVKDCVASKDNLTFHCKADQTSQQKVAEIKFTLSIADQTQAEKQERKESASLLLPYAVGIAAGLVPAVPFKYDATREGGGLHLAEQPANVPVALGFQQYSYPAKGTAFDFPASACIMGDRLFFRQGVNYIYEVKNGLVSLYAGAEWSAQRNEMGHRLRTNLAPTSIACAADALYVTSYEYCEIYKITDEGPVQVVAGRRGDCASSQDGPSAVESSLNHPMGITLSTQGDVYFTETLGAKIRKIAKDGTLKTIAVTGENPDPNVALPTSWPMALAVDKNDFVYFVDYRGHMVKKVGADGKIVDLAGIGKPRSEDPSSQQKGVSEPVMIALTADGSVYFSEYYRGVKKISSDGTVTQVLSSGADFYGSVELLMSMPTAENKALFANRAAYQILIIDKDGSIYTDHPKGIMKYSSDGKQSSVIVGEDEVAQDCKKPLPSEKRRFYEASGLAYDKDNKLLIQDWKDLLSNQVVVWEIAPSNGEVYSRARFGCDNDPLFNSPNASAGYLVPVNSLGTMASAADGSVYMSLAMAGKIVKIDPSGHATAFAGSGKMVSSAEKVAAKNAGLGFPLGLAVGREGALYFVEYGGTKLGSRIRKITPEGVLSTVAGVRATSDLYAPYSMDVFYGNGQPGAPWDEGEGGPGISAKLLAAGVAISPDGRIFISDYGNGKIKMVDTKGIIHTIAGGAQPKFWDGEVVAADAALFGPSSIAVTNDNTVYFVDYGSRRVLELKEDAKGQWMIKPFFGGKNTGDCGTTRTIGEAKAGDAANAIKSSLSIICEGQPRAISVKDTCAGSQGETRIVISQDFYKYMNVVEIIKPCI